MCASDLHTQQRWALGRDSWDLSPCTWHVRHLWVCWWLFEEAKGEDGVSEEVSGLKSKTFEVKSKLDFLATRANKFLNLSEPVSSSIKSRW